MTVGIVTPGPALGQVAGEGTLSKFLSSLEFSEALRSKKLREQLMLKGLFL